MKKSIIPIVLIVLLAACATLDKEASSLFDQVRYEEQISKREVKSEDYPNSPKKMVRKVAVMSDSVSKIIYSTVITQKRYKDGHYHLMKNSVDTVQLNESGDSFEKSEYAVNGIFVSPRGGIQRLESSRNIVFNSDWTCVESWEIDCPDGGCSTALERMGVYRMIHDTLNVAFYRSRALYSGHRDVLKMKDVQWHVSMPTSYQFKLTANADSLMLYDESEVGMSVYLVAHDTIQVLPNLR